jgi:hypothetical protein
MQTVTLKLLFHRNEERIGICFAHDRELVPIVKKIPGTQWSQTHRCWHTLLSRTAYDALIKAIGHIASIDNSSLKQYLQHKNKIAATMPPCYASVRDTRNKKNNHRLASCATTTVRKIKKQNGQSIMQA